MPILTWMWAATAFAGKRALKRAALGALALPGGVVVESGAPWDVRPAGEQGQDGLVAMQAAHAVATTCFAGRMGVDPLSGEITGWSVVVDVVPGAEGVTGPPLVDGITLDGELECIQEGLAALDLPPIYGMTLRVASPGPTAIVGNALVTVEGEHRTGDNHRARRALRFELRASEVALACARRVGSPPSGVYVGRGTDLFGAPESFAACWSELATALEPWLDEVDPDMAFRLRFTSI